MRTLTVGIPTRDRPAQLAGLLEVLRGELPPPGWTAEVLVADGSARPAAPADVQVLPVRGGVSAGRNALQDHASGDVLVLVDDDVRPDPGALAALAAAVEPGTAVAGRVRGLGHRAGEDSRPMRLARTGYGEPADDEPDYLVSALLALPRDVYTRVRWDERFPDAHLDDVAFGLRLREAGVVLRQCDEATADHPPRTSNDRPDLARQRALVVLTRWRAPGPWARCLAHVAWEHRRHLPTAVRSYLAGTAQWRAAR